MRAGPKRAVTDFPLDLSFLPRQRAARAIEFIQTFLIVPKGHGARKPVRLRDWQREIIHGLLSPGIRQALISLPRGNGKSALAAMLALYGLFADGVEGAQVLTVASDERQARHVWGMARRMIELNEELNGQVQMFQDRIYAPHTDSTLAPLPAEPDALQGWDPSMCIVDELHVVTDEVYDAMQLASGKRDRSLVLSISTAAGDKDGVMYRLTEHGRTGDDPSFYLCEYNVPDGCDLDDEAAWHIANPALHDFLAIDALRSTLKTTREEVFRRYRLNQWVGTVGAWMPWGSWEEVVDNERLIDPEEPVVLAFDGSISDDSSAIVGCTVNDSHIFVVNLWEKDGEPGWRVPRAEVTRAVDSAFERYSVTELACDPLSLVLRAGSMACQARRSSNRVAQ